MSFRSFCAALAALTIFTSFAHADTIYRETFGRPGPGTTTNIGTQVFDWGRYNAAGTVASTTSGVNGGGAAGDQPGKPQDLANINAGANADATTGAYPLGWAFLDGTARLGMTTEYAVDPTNYVSGSIAFSWYQGNALNTGNTPNPFQVAVRIGGVWYASNTTFVNTTPVTGGANFGLPNDGSATSGSQLMSFTYDPTAANWKTLNFDGNFDVSTHTASASTVALSLGAAPGSDLSGIITGFGLYRDITGGNARWDSFQIDAIPVPEPATWVLGVLAGCALPHKRQRKH